MRLDKERQAKNMVLRLKKHKKKGRTKYITGLISAIRAFNSGQIDIYELDREIFVAEEFLDGAR